MACEACQTCPMHPSRPLQQQCLSFLTSQHTIRLMDRDSLLGWFNQNIQLMDLYCLGVEQWLAGWKTPQEACQTCNMHPTRCLTTISSNASLLASQYTIHRMQRGSHGLLKLKTQPTDWGCFGVDQCLAGWYHWQVPREWEACHTYPMHTSNPLVAAQSNSSNTCPALPHNTDRVQSLVSRVGFQVGLQVGLPVSK